jgi:hypothetical protein
VADGETSLPERQGGIAGTLFVGREHPDKPMPLTDGSLTRADFAGVGQEDLGAGEVDT